MHLNYNALIKKNLKNKYINILGRGGGGQGEVCGTREAWEVSAISSFPLREGRAVKIESDGGVFRRQPVISKLSYFPSQ